MSGHSKWSTIKRKKAAADSKRGKIFTKLIKEIQVAAKMGGGDQDSNSRLRNAIDAAKSANMPLANVEKAIKKGTGDLEGVNYEEHVYEAYGPGGVAILLETMTDNKNRTAADIRHIFDKFGGNLGTSGCVSYMFDRKGVIIIEKKEGLDEDTVMMAALEAGADDVVTEEEYFEIITDVTEFSSVREELEKSGYEFLEAQLQMIPQTMVKLDEKHSISMEKLIDTLEDNDDVQNIYHNWEI